MLSHREGERRIKCLQKEFLHWVEEHPQLKELDSHLFNDLRRRAFRATFDAFRLGIVGLAEDVDREVLWNHFFGWVEVDSLPDSAAKELKEECLRVALEAFRTGALVSPGREA